MGSIPSPRNRRTRGPFLCELRGTGIPEGSRPSPAVRSPAGHSVRERGRAAPPLSERSPAACRSGTHFGHRQPAEKLTGGFPRWPANLVDQARRPRRRSRPSNGTRGPRSPDSSRGVVDSQAAPVGAAGVIRQLQLVEEVVVADVHEVGSLEFRPGPQRDTARRAGAAGPGRRPRHLALRPRCGGRRGRVRNAPRLSSAAVTGRAGGPDPATHRRGSTSAGLTLPSSSPASS